MALVVSTHAKARVVDPTSSLKEALEDFAAILTDEQKRQYQASTEKPDAASVVKFVSDIDTNNSSAKRRGVAARLVTFLDATQKFSSIVETFVSSNPAIAALVWGGVKTTILTANNVASYFDNVTKMIMDIGRSCPTYQQFGQLYPGCVGLQCALCDYYAIIVRLCIKVIEVSRRTGVTQTISSIFNPFESEFKEYLNKLDQAVKDIQLQISLASKQADQEANKLSQLERQENAKFRSSTLSFLRGTTKEHAEAHQWRINQMKREAARLKSKIRDNLSTINHVKPWKLAMQQRVPATAEWLSQESAFHEWKDSQNTAILWCSGTMGVGKTVLISNVVAQLHTSGEINASISYYFCRADNEASLSARNILGSLARQILETQIEHAEDDDLERLHEDSRDLDTTEVVDLLLTHLEIDKKYYLILDGLDECDRSEIRKLGLSLAKLCDKRFQHLNIKILCASRPDLEKLLFRVLKPMYKVSVTKKKVESDMDEYIDTILGRCLKEEQLKLRDPTLIVRISNALREGSDGMFLWTSLVIEELCARRNDNEIVEALEHLPRGLSEVFDRKLRRIRDGRAAEEAIKTLQFCGVVKRPLTLMECQETLSLSPWQKSFDRGKVPNDMHQIISDCCGLTFVDEEENTVHYVHHSVKQHLFATNSPHLAEFNLAKANRCLGLLCMTYLNLADFKRQLIKVKEGSSTPIKPLQLALLPISRSRGPTSRLALKLLPHSRHLQHLSARELQRKTQELLGDIESQRLELELQLREFHFLTYAGTFWLDHLPNLDNNTDDKMWRLLCRCIESNDIPAWRPWESEHEILSVTLSEIMSEIRNERNGIPKSVQWLLAHENYTLLLYQARHQLHILTERVKQEVLRNAAIHDRYRFTEIIVQLSNNTSATLNYGLLYAAREGRADSLASLIRAGADINVPAANDNGRTALQAAAEGGHLKVVDILLATDAKVNVNAPAGKVNGRTALQAAAEGGHLSVVERLLAAEANVNAPAAKVNGRTALQAAAGGGHLDVIEILLAAETKANVNTPAGEYQGRTALQAAAEGGHLNVVERLLATGANVNALASRFYGETALQAAAGGGHLDVLERLLAAKANVNAPGGEFQGQTALQAAARGGYLNVVERLLVAKADVNAPPDYGQTALQAAAGGGHLDVVERLLAAKADVNVPAGEYQGRTALQAAAEGGHLRIVERLLPEADVNAPTSHSNGRTALQAAAEGGHLNVIRRLLEANADINAPAGNCYGRTALQAAAGGGHLDVVEMLLAAQADVNAPAGDSLHSLQTPLEAAANAYVDGRANSQARTALQAAAEGGHLRIVERLLAAEADVNTPVIHQYSGRTALQAAAAGGYLNVIEKLLAAKADINARASRNNGRTALQAAAGGGHLEVVERLLATKANVNMPACEFLGRTALQAAAEAGHLKVVERLLTANANVNAPVGGPYGRTALQAAAGRGHLDVVERLLAAKADINAPAVDTNGRTALQAAAGGGHLDVVERLLEADADVNTPASKYQGRTALQAAAEGGYLKIVERLLAANANVNAPAGDDYGLTAAQAAAGGGHLDVVERLLAAKADINALAVDTNGRTALQAASQGGHLEVVEILLAAKANVHAPAGIDNGRTALQAAAEGGHLEVVDRLLAANANVYAPASITSGRTALDAAAEGGFFEVVERLRQAKYRGSHKYYIA